MRIVSGIQPTGNLHLGNYLGAIRNWVRMQDALEQTGGDCFFFLADLHAISQYQEPAELHRAIREMAAALIACGIDPDRATLFRQRDVPAHSELAWLLNGVARVGWLNRMTQFKDKSGKNREGASVALYTYPVLQAADVLLYNATHVPVGEDQKQHLELARDIAQKFNNDFGVPDFFPLPEPVITGAGTRVMSLRDGTKKMSKSDESDMSRINLTDDADAIANKIKRARTDPHPLPASKDELKDRPEAENLLNIYAALADQDRDAVIGQFAGQQFSGFKTALADLTVAKLEPINQKMRQLLADPAEIDRVLRQGAHSARSIATPIMDEVKRRVGFIT